MQRSVRALDAIAGLVVGSEEVTAEEFEAFVTTARLATREVHALEWVERVPGDALAGFSEQMQARGVLPHGVHGGRRDDAWLPVAPREEHFPVLYVAPLEGNEAALGFDLASGADRLSALEKAADSGESVALPHVSLVQLPGAPTAVLIFRPVYGSQHTPETEAERRASLRGFALGVFLAEGLFRGASHVSQADLGWVLSEVQSDGTVRELFREGVTDGAGSARADLRVPSGIWRMQVVGTPAFADHLTGGRANVILLTGILLVLLLGGTLALYGLHAHRIAKRLAASNEALTRGECESRAIQLRCVARPAGAPARDQRIRRVAGPTLRGQVRRRGEAVAGLRQRRRATHGSPGARPSHLCQVCNGALPRWESVSLDAAFSAALGEVQDQIEESGARIEREPLPEVTGDAHQLRRLCEVLVSNAVRFCEEGHAPNVHVTAIEDAHEIGFAVTDDGIGIPSEYTDAIFEVFKRLHAYKEFPGAGLGLSEAARIARDHGAKPVRFLPRGGGIDLHGALPPRSPDGRPAQATRATCLIHEW